MVQFQKVYESQRIDGDAIDIARGSSADKWIFVGAKRIHTHDVRALAIATPIVAPINPTGTPWDIHTFYSFLFMWIFKIVCGYFMLMD